MYEYGAKHKKKSHYPKVEVGRKKGHCVDALKVALKALEGRVWPSLSLGHTIGALGAQYIWNLMSLKIQWHKYDILVYGLIINVTKALINF